ncbi:MAG: alpha-E domain-containing protein [Phycisphaerae bacterium]|nr:alpha-E domain-containing protein [Tepidisphaeraceae bacterium]
MSIDAPPIVPVAIVNRPPRPLLSRVAESAFWMSRYVERAEHVARVLTININSLLDVGDVSEEVERQFWSSCPRIFLVDSTPEARTVMASPRESLVGRIAQYMTFDLGNPNSMLSCITRARENARSIRENISSEMWENLNTLYWSLRSDDVSGRFEESPVDLLKQVMAGSFLFQGLAAQTLPHGQVVQFCELGKYLERIDVTCRILEVKLEILREVQESIESSERNTHLLSIVRSCCALESFRRNVGDIDPDRIAAFLLLERNFPRSVCFSSHEAHRAISQIHALTKPAEMDACESVLGRLQSDLHYTQPPEVAGSGLGPYLQRVQSGTVDAVMALKKSYFLQ